MESQKHTANNQVRHMLRILNAAKPYMADNVSQSIDFISKAEDLFSAIPSRSSRKGPLHAMEVPDGQDPERRSSHAKNVRPVSEHTIEQMLTDVKKVCSPPEQASINTILNLIQARKLYQSYLFYSQESKDKENYSMLDFLKKQMGPEQARTFELLKNAMQ